MQDTLGSIPLQGEKTGSEKTRKWAKGLLLLCRESGYLLVQSSQHVKSKGQGQQEVSKGICL